MVCGLYCDLFILILFHRFTVNQNIGCRTSHVHKCMYKSKIKISKKVTINKLSEQHVFTTVAINFQHINHLEHMYNYGSHV
jgi:hypothetical protein